MNIESFLMYCFYMCASFASILGCYYMSNYYVFSKSLKEDNVHKLDRIWYTIEVIFIITVASLILLGTKNLPRTIAIIVVLSLAAFFGIAAALSKFKKLTHAQKLLEYEREMKTKMSPDNLEG